MWEYPAAAREAYRQELGLDEETWRRATAWKLIVNLGGIVYYWQSWPEFAQDCLSFTRELLDDCV